MESHGVSQIDQFDHMATKSDSHRLFQSSSRRHVEKQVFFRSLWKAKVMLPYGRQPHFHLFAGVRKVVQKWSKNGAEMDPQSPKELAGTLCKRISKLVNKRHQNEFQQGPPGATHRVPMGLIFLGCFGIQPPRGQNVATLSKHCAKKVHKAPKRVPKMIQICSKKVPNMCLKRSPKGPNRVQKYPKRVPNKYQMNNSSVSSRCVFFDSICM